MRVLHRTGYYLGGFSIGLILLAFFVKGSGVELPSCDYMPNARVLKTIRNNGYALSQNAEKELQALQLDTTDLNVLFLEGEVDFNKSDTRREPCGFYNIYSQESVETPIIATLENCNEKFTVLSVEKK
ncbi:hypothetical protein [Leeuwenhoekiella sp. NPDC079379]|uniref:hypothetical protein n=1 Tax=Leeuwenhoekiella sp. NPDC079379 TaxID=3364122 RepID=UPI0037C5191A